MTPKEEQEFIQTSRDLKKTMTEFVRLFKQQELKFTLKSKQLLKQVDQGFLSKEEAMEILGSDYERITRAAKELLPHLRSVQGPSFEILTGIPQHLPGDEEEE